MPKSLIVYFSQGGTTARVAEWIATGLRAGEWQVDLYNLKDGRPPEPSGYELIGLGSPAYFYRPPFNVTDYVRSLPDLTGRACFVFVVYGTLRGDSGNALRRELARRGAREAGYFHCRGADYFLGYLKRGYLFSPDHPTAEELARAEAFGREVSARLAGAEYAVADEDPPAPLVYRLERSLLSRPLVSHIYSRMFGVDAGKCSSCGLCMKLCPTRNIGEDGAGRPVWGRECLLCLSCEQKCPEDAIGSPVSLPLFGPFMMYNVRHAARDPMLDHVAVHHSRGRTRRV